jgi:hypothetical protein
MGRVGSNLTVRSAGGIRVTTQEEEARTQHPAVREAKAHWSLLLAVAVAAVGIAVSMHPEWGLLGTASLVFLAAVFLAVLGWWAWGMGGHFRTLKPVTTRIIYLATTEVAAVVAIAFFALLSASQRAQALSHVDTGITLEYGLDNHSVEPLETKNVWRWDSYPYIVQSMDKKTGKLISSTTGMWLLSMDFDKPVPLKFVKVTADGGPLPNYEVRRQDQRGILVFFSGDLAGRVVHVSVENDATSTR